MVVRLIMLIIAVSSFSCISVSQLEIHVLEPAANPLPAELNSLILLNRTIADTSLLPVEAEKLDSITSAAILADILNKTTTELIFALADILNESPGMDYIDSTMILEMASESDHLPLPLDSLFVKELCDPLAADAIISLEYLKVKYGDSIRNENWNAWSVNSRYYWAKIDVDITSGWRIYEGAEGRLIDEHVFMDTLMWDYTDWDMNGLMYQLPALEEFFMETAYFTALAWARRISPHWVLSERTIYFRGNRSMRNAYRYFIANELDFAEAIYLEQLDRLNSSMVAAAMHNLALVYEMRGNIRQALVWARRSFQLARKELTADYIEILEERVELRGKLDRQLGVE